MSQWPALNYTGPGKDDKKWSGRILRLPWPGGGLSDVSVKDFLECPLLHTTVNVLPMSQNYWLMRAYHRKIEPCYNKTLTSQIKDHLVKTALNIQDKSQTIYIIFSLYNVKAVTHLDDLWTRKYIWSKVNSELFFWSLKEKWRFLYDAFVLQYSNL